MLSSRRLLALALLAALWLGPLPGLAAGSMVLHMGLHLGVTAVVPALWAPKLPLPSGAMALVLGAVAEMAVVWVWHLPAMHLWARLSTTGLVLEQGSFLIAGLMLWASVRAAGRFGLREQVPAQRLKTLGVGEAHKIELP